MLNRSIALPLLAVVWLASPPASTARADDVAAATTTTASGTVLAPDGKPVADAEVIVATPDRAAWPNLPADQRDEWRRGAGTAKTDKAGRFTVELPPGAALLSVHHPKHGYAEVSPTALDGQPEVKLEPWCRIEGVFKIGAKTAPAGTKVGLGTFGWGAQAARVHYGYETTTDADGRYVLDRVPAGLAPIAIRPSPAASHVQQFVGAEPGKTTRFNIGGKGRPVIGKLVLGEGLDLADLFDHSKPDRLYHTSYFRRKGRWPAERDPHAQGTDQEQEEAARAWRRTAKVIAAHKNEYRADHLNIRPDGTFRLDDVPPGTYELSLSVSRLGNKAGETVAKIEMDVVVPASRDLPTDEPLDLGELEPGGAGNEGL